MTGLRTLWEKIERLFQPYLVERAIKEVDSWDGSASNYETTESYCNACLINVNAAAGVSDSADWTQDHCMLPVREPGDGAGTYVKQAVYAAAGGRGISAVERPEDVSTEDWEAAVKEAANKLIGAYGEMDETAPDAVYTAAGKESPEERAVNLGMAWGAVDEIAWNDNIWLHDLYADDDGGLYAVGSREGKLYRADVLISGGETAVSEWTEVEVQHVPVTRGITIKRQENGIYRWAGVACTALLNKDGEIDSSILFERFVEGFNERALDTDPVKVDFVHEDIFLGDVDYLGTDGYVLVASGTFRDDEIGRAAAETILAEPDEWGQSISYKPMAPPAILALGDGIEFPVWEEGQLERIALLPRDWAAAWYTTFNTRSGAMKKEIQEALERLVGKDAADALATQVDGVNDRVTSDGLIARQAEDQVTEQDEAEEQDEVNRVEGDEPATESTSDGEAEDAQLPADVQVIRELRAAQQETNVLLTTLADTLSEFIPDVQERLGALEQTEQERQAAWTADLPTPKPRTIVRPRQARAAEDDGEQTVDSSEHVRQVMASKGIAAPE